ncbi:feather keratin Cos2-2-like isoform X4 [Serinus canaria]|uniref:feather keratin Cos2-2-like isoform X2 n=1 Tax=Serinus canaria TaxID=9135 RepID=UPI0021CC6243|nr:feather keratin Cos2-2-like isoform X2 [Serinus canaria]XP_050841576.1 feather keratin Cos2-2-like isoform X3 [Serinus canaria]XP_050841577.1 feather keratin Cos2-2-like isoform X4 [Serinus canaria]
MPALRRSVREGLGMRNIVTLTAQTVGPEALWGKDKRQPNWWLSQPLLSPPSPWNQVQRQAPDMSCSEKCQQCQPCDPCCQSCGPCPLASSCNECCVRQCQSSHVVIEPPAVLVTLPGPILSSFPQNTAVGSSTSAAVGSILSSQGVPISSGGFDISCITNCCAGSRCCRPC